MKTGTNHLFISRIPCWGLGAVAAIGLTAATANATAAVSAKDFLAMVHTNAQGAQLPYRLFVPARYDSPNRYPLVLFWHDLGFTGTNNLSQLTDEGQFVFLSPTHQAKYPCFFLAPQIPQVGTNCNYYYGIGEQTMELLGLLQAEFSLDPDRCYVTGASLGGNMTWGSLAKYPHLFAAGVPMAGTWGCSDIRDLYLSIRAPVWNFHAADE
jgi:predicted peptidase